MICSEKHVLPNWYTDRRDTSAHDPIGCPITIEEMIRYLNPLLPFKVGPTKLNFICKGKIDSCLYWFWAFYGDDRHRWNLCVFSGPDPVLGPPGKTWMCADNNFYNLNDYDYIMALYNQEY
jgi:hypothetical protein